MLSRPRWSLRTTMALVAATALLFGSASRWWPTSWIPDAFWKLRLERSIAAKVEGTAPGDQEVWSNPSFQYYHGLTAAELADFRRDPGLVFDRLLRSVAGPRDEDRRRKVLRALGIYLDEVKGPELPRLYIARGVGMLASGSLPVALEEELARDIAWRARTFGIEEADRKAFRERARVVLRGELPHPDFAKCWACSLVWLGGDEEKAIILGAWGRLDGNGRSKMLEMGIVGE